MEEKISLQELQEKHPDCVMLLRKGDFYEVRGKFAETVSEELGLLLSRHTTDRSLFCAFETFKLDSYLPKLIRQGHRVAILEAL